MLKIFVLLAMVPLQPALASDRLSADEIRGRLQIRSEIFYLDKEGKRLLGKRGEYRTMRFARNADKSADLKDQWGSNANEPNGLAIRTSWHVLGDGSIGASIEEYSGEKRTKDARGDPAYELTGLLKKEEIFLKNFGSFSYVSARPNAKENVVVRFTPELLDDETPTEFKEMPIVGNDIFVTDNKGNLWASLISTSAKYVGARTSRGSFAISLYPFANAKPIGQVSGRRIELSFGKSEALTLTSEKDFLPQGMRSTVYGFVDLSLKTGRPNSTQTYSSNQEKPFLNQFKN